MAKIISIGIVIAVLLVGGAWWSRTLVSNDDSVVSQNGLHWHPRLAIYVKGEKVEIPQDIGIGPQYAGMPTFDSGMQMTAMHTHEDLPAIHLEFPGLVREEDIMLGNFFLIWGKDLRSFGNNMLPSDELGSTEASRLNVRLVVNGKENTEYERYIMRDKDVIELHYD